MPQHQLRQHPDPLLRRTTSIHVLKGNAPFAGADAAGNLWVAAFRVIAQVFPAVALGNITGRWPMCNDNYPVRLATIAVAGWAGLLATEDIVAAGFATGSFDGLVGGLTIELFGMEGAAGPLSHGFVLFVSGSLQASRNAA